MASLNKVFLIGNLTRDPELRYTPNGIAVVSLGLAVNRRYKDKMGELKEEVLFINASAWNKQAEVCNQYLKKGRPVFIEGQLQSRSWEGKDGQKRTTIDVRVERVQFLGSSPKGVNVAAPEVSEESPAGDYQGKENVENKPESVSWDEEENVV